MSEDFESKTGFILGLASIVLAFTVTIGGLVAGILGYNLVKKHNNPLSKKAKKMNLIGIVLSIILLILVFVASFYYASSLLGQQLPASFPK